MLRIEKSFENDTVCVALEGRLDSLTAPELEAALQEALAPVMDRIRLLGYIRFLYLVAALRLGGEDLLETRIRRAVQRLEELSAAVDDYAI